MVLRTLLIPKGQKGVEKWEGLVKQVEGGRRDERLVNTSQEREKRERVPDNSMKLFGVWNALCELSIYRKNSQLRSEKLWEQVIHYFVIK
jgi:hypothetical protein